MAIPITQAERDRLEGVNAPGTCGAGSLRDAVNLAKRIQITKPIGLCQQGCGARVIYWQREQVENGRTCHVCQAANVLFLMAGGLR